MQRNSAGGGLPLSRAGNIIAHQPAVCGFCQPGTVTEINSNSKQSGNTWSTLGALAVFVLLLFLMLEMTVRVYLFGLAGLSPAKVGSFVNIFHSGYVQPADNLDVWFELKPNLDVVFRGAPLQTNSRGLPDQEYELAKPPGTYRVAVIGSSWTMGAGVAVGDAFHSQLERKFNSADSPIRYEFINFGIENYGLGEMMGVIRHKALAYEPDMILFVMTGFTPAIRWASHDAPFEPRAVEQNAWSSYAFMRLQGWLGLRRGTGEQEALRETVRMNEWGAYFMQVRRALDELAELSTANGIAVGVTWLRFNPEPGRIDEIFLDEAGQRGLTGAVIDIDGFLQAGEPVSRILINRSDKHPNEYAHSRIAERMYTDVFAGQLPVPAN
jgi:hypothetical protein